MRTDAGPLTAAAHVIPCSRPCPRTALFFPVIIRQRTRFLRHVVGMRVPTPSRPLLPAPLLPATLLFHMLTPEGSRMLPTSTRSITIRNMLLLLLACAAGAIDAISYLGLGRVFTANMTGNTVLLGLALVQADHRKCSGRVWLSSGFSEAGS